MNTEKLVSEIIEGRRLERDEGLHTLIHFFESESLDIFTEGADKLRKHFIGERVNLCAIVAGKSGNCGENCKFCAQSAHNPTGCEVHKLMEYDEIYAEARSDEEAGVDRFAIVISGRKPSGEDFMKLLEIYRKLRDNLKISLCASLGFLSQEQFNALYAAGVTNYHNNIETSRSYFEKICTTHSFDDKVANILRAKKAGLNVCSGGIIGMGESFGDRIDMAFDLAELEIKSIPINVLLPIKGTPLESIQNLSEEEILRTIAAFRFINPEADIRMAAGRILIKDNGKKAFESGISSTITGNMLTTTGSTIERDISMLKSMGR
ncbi:MAG: biotin synthase BioB [Eubacterium sp.]|nr:biotin synthase BioB [Eubacterium sp.]